MSAWLVVGSNGMLGQELLLALGERGPAESVIGVDLGEIDITDADSVNEVLTATNHDVCINAAAYTAVDLAESNEEKAFAVNALGPQLLAQACAATDTALISISTDYVFDGSATEPYLEDSARSPESAYGRTKEAGEVAALQAHPDGTYIVRTAWLYGEFGPNFPKTVLRLTRGGTAMNVVDDQIGQPTWARDLAHGLIALGDTQPDPGIYHYTSSGETSWFEFARAIVAQDGHSAQECESLITGISTSGYPTPAKRPPYSVLAHQRWSQAGLPAPTSWQDALSRADVASW